MGQDLKAKVAETQGFVNTSTQWSRTSNGKESSIDWSSCIRMSFKNRGIPQGVIDTVFKSWKEGTKKQYSSAWKKWSLWCCLRNCDSIRPLETDLVAYLLYLKNIKKSYSVISSHKSTIFETLKIVNPSFPTTSNLIYRFMKGLKVEIPPKPRYSSTWDVGQVLDLISKWTQIETLSLKLLTYKLVSLLALSTAARSQTLKALRVDQVIINEDKIIFNCGDKLKNSKPGKDFLLELKTFVKPELCPVRTVLCYLNRTEKLRKDEQLLISFVNYKAVSTSTIARWLKSVLILANVDISIFKAHSFRSASSSAAAHAGCKISDILKTASWSSAKTFNTFYLRRTDKLNSNFQDSAK